ncbi:MAG: PHP domain-containing protein [Leptolyngbyaceae cyanobacterium SL_7_1]|nr:PHP domain-containing protein [Leptolyngbyaceae cyanobacterium SL_7_1]
MIDLHCHTTCSDGTLTPTELVNAAIAAGITKLAITDHDTLAAWNEAIAAAADFPIEIIPGLELSTVYNGRSLHLLGFYPQAEKLLPPLQDRLAGRHRRAQAILDKLADLGYPVALPNLNGIAPGRPHIAAALVMAGHAQSTKEAFDRWLGDDKPAYVEYEKFSAIEGINLLRQCGAVPVWAHPYLFRGGDVETVLPELVAAGLMGVEVYHPSHSPSETRRLTELCQHYGLLLTGGSDYHGPSANGRDTANHLNQMQLPVSLLEPIKRAAVELAVSS